VAFIEIASTVYFSLGTGDCLLLETGDYLLLETGDKLLFGTFEWVECPDVLQSPGPRWEYGLPGNDVMDLVGSTGILTFTLDNSPANSAGLTGYYSPGHANCPDWFTDGLRVMVIVERLDTHDSNVKFVGFITDMRPTSGAYELRTTEVEAHDWMDYLSVQRIGQIPLDVTATVDDALTTALTHFDVQPTATDLHAGDETFAYIFNTDDSVKMSMASLFQKLARNEMGGYIFLAGDGTLTFHERSYRSTVTTAAFSLDATADYPMTELEMGWRRSYIRNRVECKCYPSKIDAAATTLLWKLQETFPLANGASIELVCPFRDPTTGGRISATDVVTPLVSGTHIKFGSVDDGSTNDLIANLTYPMTVGANTAKIVMTNSGALGYVNFLELKGKGIYTYDPIVMTDQNDASVAERGVRTLAVNLELIADPNDAQSYATLLLGLLQDPHPMVSRVTFLANYTSDLATAALDVDPNVRFAIVEPQSAVNAHYFANRIKFEQRGPQLWVTIVPTKASDLNYFIWDVADHGWDEGVWTF